MKKNQRKEKLVPRLSDPAYVGRIKVAGYPICFVPDSARNYPNFLAWWSEKGRLNPNEPQGWSTISGPWVMRGRVEAIGQEDWEALPHEEREMIEAWASALPIGLFYD